MLYYNSLLRYYIYDLLTLNNKVREFSSLRNNAVRRIRLSTPDMIQGLWTSVLRAKLVNFSLPLLFRKWFEE